jgi:general secretion pathway protein D
MSRRSFAPPLPLVSLLLLLSFPHAEADSTSAKKLYKQGLAAETSGNITAAYDAYFRAYEKNPADMRFRLARERTRTPASAEYVRMGEKLRDSHRLTEALVRLYRALEIDPGNELADRDIHEVEQMLNTANPQSGAGASDAIVSEHVSEASPPPQLKLTSAESLTLHMVAQSDTAYRAIGKTAGINVLFDPEYTPKRVDIDLREVTVYEALRILSDLSGSFWKPVTHNTIFVAANTRAKRTALEEQAVQAFYLSNISQPSDLNEVQTVLRTMVPNAKTNVVPSQNAILLHGTPDELLLAKMLLASLDKPKPEVVVDITVMEVSRDLARTIGLSPPTSLAITSGTSTTGASQTLNQIGRSSSYSISVGQAAADLLLSDSDTRILQNPRLRATDGQKATLKIGERLPVAMGSFTSTAVSTGVETQFQYIDVGVNVDMTPTIHSNRDVTLKLSVEVSADASTETIDDLAEPVISQQKTEQTIRLKDGEVNLIAGLVQKQDSKTISGWPGLGELPLIKYLFTTQKHEVSDDEIVFMVVPHVVRAAQSGPEDARQIDTGSGTAIDLRREQ